MKIVAFITSKSNQQFIVVGEPVKLFYTKFDPDTIIGQSKDGLFYAFFKREFVPSKYGQAFAGRTFELPLTDGTIEKCHGQWWDAMSPAANVLMEGISLCNIGVGSVEALRKCYCYCGYYVDRDRVNEILQETKPPVYEYWEYEKILKTNY